ncbi:MAG: aminodeoxychorismate synthase component I [Gemmatimonadetes bacterium]|nr:aminodeoxychorismate synthase component I [Gemmatimonadota bacterium]
MNWCTDSAFAPGEPIPRVRLDAVGNDAGAADGGRSFVFDDPVGVIRAEHVQDVAGALEQIEAVVADGLHAAGFISYEAAAGLDEALVTGAPRDGTPLLWFGLFRTRQDVAPLAGLTAPPQAISAWLAEWTHADHEARVERVRDWIGAGDTYQVNLTMRLRAAFDGDPEGLYHALCLAQPTPLCALVDTGTVVLCSASPELHFSLDHSRLLTRPMKGTRPRGRWAEEDEELARELSSSSKERAENTMIVDLLRNDLGRVSVPGSVCVEELWNVERYRTVWQMTSSIGSDLRPDTSLVELMGALFPCGSVTGAPKIRTMQIIDALEDNPRGVYTGSIGFLSPAADGPVSGLAQMEARFSVAIRTVEIDRQRQQVVAGVGGGITWDSSAAAEYDECLAKARFLSAPVAPIFDLLETMRWEPGAGIWLAERHWDRLSASALYFGYPFDVDQAWAQVKDVVVGHEHPLRLRLTLSAEGAINVTIADLSPDEQEWVAEVSPRHVDSQDVFLYHKTTNRRVYEEAQMALDAQIDEAVLLNERGEVTETVRGNLVAVLDGRRVTPPREVGLLPGTYRAELLENGEVEERILHIEDLLAATAVYSVNSLRRWVRLNLRLADARHDVRAS